MHVGERSIAALNTQGWMRRSAVFILAACLLLSARPSAAQSRIRVDSLLLVGQFEFYQMAARANAQLEGRLGTLEGHLLDEIKTVGDKMFLRMRHAGELARLVRDVEDERLRAQLGTRIKRTLETLARETREEQPLAEKIVELTQVPATALLADKLLTELRRSAGTLAEAAARYP